MLPKGRVTLDGSTIRAVVFFSDVHPTLLEQILLLLKLEGF